MFRERKCANESIYQKGDGGNTSLANGMSVSKADDRIELIGTIDELNSYIGHAKVLSEDHLKTNLAEIQRTLMKIMAAVQIREIWITA